MHSQQNSNDAGQNGSHLNSNNNNDKLASPNGNVNGDLIADHLTDTKLLLNGMDSRVGHQRGYYTLPSRHKKVFEEGGSYRAVTKIRPVMRGNSENIKKDVVIKRNLSMSNKMPQSPISAPPPPPPPPEHPPPPPPITQVMKVDNKSDYAKLISNSNPSDQNNDPHSVSDASTLEGMAQTVNEESVVSPGGTVRSSFKPSDNAKLYASPQTVQQLAYRSPVTTNRAIFENLNSKEGKPRGSPVKKRSPTARANSMPPRPTRPQVLRRSSTTDMQLQPSASSISTTTSGQYTAATEGAETYNINGVSYTTYTTFRSPITPDECDVPGSLSSRTFAGIDPDLTPTASEPERFAMTEGQPVIPEPDYDLSDSDYGGSSSNGNNYYSGSDVYNSTGYHANGVRNGMGSNGTTLERKKKKTVSFVINEEVAAKLQAGRTTRQDSILKDPAREREKEKERFEQERFEREREELFSTSKQKRPMGNKTIPVDQPSPFALGEKYADSIVKIPMARLKAGETHSTNSSQNFQPNYQLYGIDINQPEEQAKTVIRVADVDKIRIEVPPEVPLKSALSRSNSAVGNATGNNSQKHQPLQKSRSFCAEKTLLSVSSENKTLGNNINSLAPQSISTTTTNINAVMSKSIVPGVSDGISENEILRVRSQLKPSRSFSNDFPKKLSPSQNKNGQSLKNGVDDNLISNDLSHEEAENSSSGVSSDQEQNVNPSNNHGPSKTTSSAKFVTYLPVDGGAASTLEVGKNVQNSNTYNGNNVVQTGRNYSDTNNMLPLQPNHQSVIDNVSESGSDDVSSEKSWVLRAEQDNLGRNIIYMKKMLHPKLQAIFDKPSNGVNGGLPGSSGSSSTNSSSPTPQVGSIPTHPSKHDNLLSSSMSANSSSSLANRTSNHKSNSSSLTPAYSTQTLPHRHQYPNYLVQQQYSSHHGRQTSNAMSSTGHQKHPVNDERSISQSLALINQHVNSLGEVNVLAGIDSKGQSEPGNVDASGAVLAPPPGFSDTESHQSTSHPTSLRNNNQLGKKVTFGKKAPESSGTDRNSLMTRSMGPSYEGYNKSQVQNSELMSQSIIDFNTTNAARQNQYSYHGGKGMRNEAKTPASTSSISYATLPKKQHLNLAGNPNPKHFGYSQQQQHQKEFRTKPLIGWTTTDVCDWLDSLFMPEYKPAFVQNEIDGFKLASITKSELESLGVIRVGHMLNIEKSLKRYLTA